MLLGDRAQQAILYKIVGPHRVPGKRARIAAQTRDFLFEKPTEIVHRAGSIAVPAAGFPRPLDRRDYRRAALTS
jgi:hypothetical protein